MKVFKYIFKQKLLISIAIVLLLVESLCTFATPYVASIAIDYGIQNNGIVFATPLQIDAYTYRAGVLLADDDVKDVVRLSYDKVIDDKVYFENDVDSCHYELNAIGYANIFRIEVAAVPLMSFLYDSVEDRPEFWRLGKVNQGDITVAEINDFRNKVQEFKNNHDFSDMYNKAVKLKLLENEYLGFDNEWYQVNFMVFISLSMLIIVILYLISCIIGTYLASKISFTISRDLRRKQFAKVMSFSNHDMDKFSRASLITRATNDLQVVQNTSVFVIRAILIAPVMMIVGFLMAYSTAPSLVWLPAVTIGAILVVAAILIAIVFPKYRLIQKLVDKINSVARESISGVPIIRALNNENFQEKRFSEVNKKLYHTMTFAMSILVIAMPILMLTVNILSVGILWEGSFQLQNGLVNIGQLIAFISYSSETIFAFFFIAAGFVMLPRADVSLGRIEEVLNHKLAIDNFNQSTKYNDDEVKDDEYIKFEKVIFDYDEGKNKIFKGLDFKVKKNSINAIVGPTGSGKSSVLKLLLRFYDVKSGKVSINGVDVKDYNEKELRSIVSYVPQKVNLFQGSLSENVRTNPNIPNNKRKVEDALRFANMGDFIDSHKDGINHVISQGAANLSGGQKQRVTIARAIYEDQPILLLDDPFSALDANTEKKINSSLIKDFKDKTILVVTQRLSSVVDYDNIIFINKGKVVATGTHKQLMKNSKEYKEAFEKALAPTIEDVK